MYNRCSGNKSDSLNFNLFSAICFMLSNLFAIANIMCLLIFLISQPQPILDATISKEITDQGIKKAQ